MGRDRALRGQLRPQPRDRLPDVGLYHPGMAQRVCANWKKLPRASGAARGTWACWCWRSYVWAENTAHYDGVIAAPKRVALRVVAAFASGLDARGAIEQYFHARWPSTVDALVRLTGFSLGRRPGLQRLERR